MKRTSLWEIRERVKGMRMVTVASCWRMVYWRGMGLEWVRAR